MQIREWFRKRPGWFKIAATVAFRVTVVMVIFIIAHTRGFTPPDAAILRIILFVLGGPLLIAYLIVGLGMGLPAGLWVLILGSLANLIYLFIISTLIIAISAKIKKIFK